MQNLLLNMDFRRQYMILNSGVDHMCDPGSSPWLWTRGVWSLEKNPYVIVISDPG